MGDINLTNLPTGAAVSYDVVLTESTMAFQFSRTDVGGTIGTLSFDKNSARELIQHLLAITGYHYSDFEAHQHIRSVYSPQTKHGHITLNN